METKPSQQGTRLQRIAGLAGGNLHISRLGFRGALEACTYEVVATELGHSVPELLLLQMMLQQTQVSRAAEYHKRWVSKWPTVQARYWTSPVLNLAADDLDQKPLPGQLSVIQSAGAVLVA